MHQCKWSSTSLKHTQVASIAISSKNIKFKAIMLVFRAVTGTTSPNRVLHYGLNDPSCPLQSAIECSHEQSLLHGLSKSKCFSYVAPWRWNKQHTYIHLSEHLRNPSVHSSIVLFIPALASQYLLVLATACSSRYYTELSSTTSKYLTVFQKWKHRCLAPSSKLAFVIKERLHRTCLTLD